MAREIHNFHPVDYVIFALMLLISAAIGVYYGCTGGKQKTTKEFLMANRAMHYVPVSLSLFASFMSAITILGTPSEIYKYGTQYWWIALSYVITMPAAAYIYIPIFYNLKVTSAYEYLEIRFNKGLRVAGVIVFMIQMLIYMSIVLYAPSLALEAVTGFSVWGSVFSVGIVCTFYTTLGGMKAVLWTDSFQVIMMFMSILAVLIQGFIEVGGISRAWEIATQNERIEIWNFDPNPAVRHTFWSLTFGGTFTWVAVYGVNQAQVQRALTCPTLKKAQLAFWLNLPALILLVSTCCLLGIVVFARYVACDPKLNGDIFSDDQILPLFVMDILHWMPGIPGLFVAGLFSGALSTISSGLNSLVAVTLQDFMRKFCCKGMTEDRATLWSKVLALIFGCICIALTFVAAQLGGILQAALALYGMLSGPMLGLFTLGMLFPWANSKGAFAGLFSSLALIFWIGIGANIVKPPFYTPPVFIHGCTNYTSNYTTLTNVTTTTVSMPVHNVQLTEITGVDKLYTVSYIWYSGISFFTVLVVGLIVSFATGATKPEEVDPRTIVPIFDVCCPFLPDNWRRRLRWGIDHTDKFAEENSDEAAEKMATFNDSKNNDDESPVPPDYNDVIADSAEADLGPPIALVRPSESAATMGHQSVRSDASLISRE
ncbi:sodium-dependent multivitamin transporter-like [Liolophura sinensis]|uniref:sodium-dependent multivitamin transporter-like n=1 Tax=Liolophura sinensis TaxID=3198878 RepID=UPI003157F279